MLQRMRNTQGEDEKVERARLHMSTQSGTGSARTRTKIETAAVAVAVAGGMHATWDAAPKMV